MRVGHGYDVHRLVRGRKLILCGQAIQHAYGLLGHSDADVAAHAVCDALLGAAAMGDIGKHFPDTDPKWKGADSMMILGQVYQMILRKGYELVNLDLTIVAQVPKLSPYIDIMLESLADTLQCGAGQINIKATTEEWLGFTGKGLGISAHCVCLIENM